MQRREIFPREEKKKKKEMGAENRRVGVGLFPGGGSVDG